MYSFCKCFRTKIFLTNLKIEVLCLLVNTYSIWLIFLKCYCEKLPFCTTICQVNNLYSQYNSTYITWIPALLYCLPLPFQILSNRTPQTPQLHCFFCCLVSLAKWVSMSHLVCYFTWYYPSTHIEHWYHSTRRTLCVLCKNVSSLLRSGL